MTTLGLDIGSNSIGFALVDEEQNKVLWQGVYIFQEGVNKNQGREESKKAARRIARQTRKMIWRRHARKVALMRLLQKIGFCPIDEAGLEKWKALDPYELRKKGLDEELSLFEFGRAIYHLNQRRGFKSNRKTASNDEGTIFEGDKKTGKGGINEIKAALDENKFRTLGEYLHSLNPHDQRRRKRYTLRAFYEKEFDLLWQKQNPSIQNNFEKLVKKFVLRKFQDKVLKKDWKYLIKDYIIFFQRKLKSQKKLIGKCTLEPQKRRANNSTLIFQEFRLLDKLHSIRINGKNRNYEPLNQKELQMAFEAFNLKKEWTIKQLLSLLNLKDYKTNYPTDEKFKGNTTAYALANVWGENSWLQLSEKEKNHIWEICHNADDENWLAKYAQIHWQLDETQAEKLKKVSFEKDYARLSQKALKKLVPLMKQGMDYTQACQKIGYQHSQIGDKNDEKLNFLEEPANIRNAIVQQALFEIRKVVNSIIKEFGKPEVIRIELARELKNSKEKREKERKDIKKNEENNKRIRKELLKEVPAVFGGKEENISREDIIKYKLWEECKGICPYTGRNIAIAQLFNGEFETEHILPYSRTLNDSFANKTICERMFNLKKGNRTPYEMFASGDISQEEYNAILQRVKDFNYNKYKKFVQKELDEDFISRQLNDTAYIAREAKKWMATILEENKVEISNGEATSILRHLWGLNNILNKYGLNIKSREDHRHHAIDAIVVACTTRSILQKLATYKAQKRKYNDEDFPKPWKNFHRDVKEAVNQILVHQRVRRRVRGKLHDETIYGAVLDKNRNHSKDEKGQKVYAVRKPLESLSPAQINKIADKTIRELVKQRIRKFGADPDARKFEIPKNCFNEPIYMPSKNGKGNPIKSVRIHDVAKNKICLRDFTDVKQENKRPHKQAYVDSGNNHHIVIYEISEINKKTGKSISKQTGEVVSLFEATERKKQGLPVINKNLGEGKRFLLSLLTNEMVLLDKPEENFRATKLKWNEETKQFYDENKQAMSHQELSKYLYRVQKMDANLNIVFRHHLVAKVTDEADSGVFRANASTFRGLKVKISPLGEISPAE
ncbi:MAG: type II CRISPR RNA-guided endonuclease Cas9 [Raineya sp.]